MVFLNSPNRQSIRPQSNRSAGFHICSHSAKIKRSRRPARGRGALSSICLCSGAVSPELRFLCSSLGLVSGLPLFPASTAIKRLDCAPSSLSRQIAVAQPSGPNHPIMPRCEAVLLLPIRIPYFALQCKPNQQSFRQRIVAPGLYWFVQPGGPLAFAAWRPSNSQENSP
jgi:hypothetical protein